jgi:hypothetical protein
MNTAFPGWGATLFWAACYLISYIFGILMVGLLGGLVYAGWGWVAGAALAAVGIPFGWVQVSVGNVSRCKTPTDKPDRFTRTAGMLESVLLVTLFGFLVGLFLGFIALLTVASWAVSPFGSGSWLSGWEAMLIVAGPAGVFAGLGFIGGVILGWQGKVKKPGAPPG